MPTVTPIRVVNPRRRKSSNRRRSNRRRNFMGGGGELALMTNPKTKRRSKANSSRPRRRRRSNPWPFVKATKQHRRRRRANPSGFRSKGRRRRNPGIVQGESLTDLLKVGVAAAGGGYGARSVTQLVLQANNTGWMGYGANILATLGLAWLAGKFLGPKIGLGVAAGGISATAIRIWSEKVSQTSPSQLSGLGDLDFSAGGLGEYVQASFSVPSNSVKDANGNYIVQNPWALPPAAAAATGAKGPTPSKPLGVVPVARFKSRFAG